MNEDFIPTYSKSVSIIREVYDWLESGLTAVLCVILAFIFIARTISVVGVSMYPTLENKDRLVITSLYDEIKVEDIVVIAMPNKNNNEPLIKRVIATGGQTIDIDANGTVFIDGLRAYETYIYEPIHPGSVFDVTFPQEVPEGHVFVMGDNRNNSLDSRSLIIGMVDERYILGKVIYRVTPYSKFGPVT